MFERCFGLLMLRPEDVLATLAGILATAPAELVELVVAPARHAVLLCHHPSREWLWSAPPPPTDGQLAVTVCTSATTVPLLTAPTAGHVCVFARACMRGRNTRWALMSSAHSVCQQKQ